MPRERVTESKTLLASELGEGTLHGGPGDRARIRLLAPVRNKDSAPMTVEVTIDLYGAMTWSGWD